MGVENEFIIEEIVIMRPSILDEPTSDDRPKWYDKYVGETFEAKMAVDSTYKFWFLTEKGLEKLNSLSGDNGTSACVWQGHAFPIKEVEGDDGFGNPIKDNLKRNYQVELLIDRLRAELSKQRIQAQDLQPKKMALDLGDVGNIIGMEVQKIIEDNPELMGFEMDDFISGLKHGKSLIDGTHG